MPAYRLIHHNGAIYNIGPNGLALGRHASSDVVINEKAVSRNHARLLLAADRCWIRDESNGRTMLNGQPVQGQQEIKPGDILQIGSAMFQLEKTPLSAVAAASAGASASQRARQKQGLLLAGGGSIVILVLTLALVFGGGPAVELDRLATVAASQTATLAPTIPPYSAMPSIEIPTETATFSPTPALFIAKIVCENRDLWVNEHVCSVTNLGTSSDSLWLAFTPFKLNETNQFNISVSIDGSQGYKFPDNEGYISLGLFASGEEKRIILRMICIANNNFCPMKRIAVQLYANDGKELITTEEGRFYIANAIGLQTTPTKKPKATDQSGGGGPAATNTPSDTGGPTPTPLPPPYP